MSIQSEIDRIQLSILAAYNAVSAKGGSVPEIKNSTNLAAAIESIPIPEAKRFYFPVATAAEEGDV